jgi:hypothetical protein
MPTFIVKGAGGHRQHLERRLAHRACQQGRHDGGLDAVAHGVASGELVQQDAGEGDVGVALDRRHQRLGDPAQRQLGLGMVVQVGEQAVEAGVDPVQRLQHGGGRGVVDGEQGGCHLQPCEAL